MSLNPDKIFRKSNNHRRNNSGELGVFEASRYYAGISENIGNNPRYASLSHKMMREDQGRVSLDMPAATIRHQLASHHGQAHEKKQNKEKKHKQPSSPGGRLASFLNSLFSQAASKKKKSKDNSIIEEESPGGRRKRRSSISHFRATTTTSSSGSGFRTPPPYVNTPTKSSYKDLRSYSDHKQVLATLSKYSISKGSATEELNQKPKGHPEDKGVKKNSGHDDHSDDGEESDSSSDLFELQLNYDMGCYSSGLPVYETTHVDTIKRSGTAITNGSIKKQFA